MLAEEHVPIIAFVWRPGEISPPVSEMARRTGSRAIFDFSAMGAEALHMFLQKADPAGHVGDIKISASTLMNPSVGRLLKETGARISGLNARPASPRGILRHFCSDCGPCRKTSAAFPLSGTCLSWPPWSRRIRASGASSSRAARPPDS